MGVGRGLEWGVGTRGDNGGGGGNWEEKGTERGGDRGEGEGGISWVEKAGEGVGEKRWRVGEEVGEGE